MPGARPELVLVMYTLLETGCRLSEICNPEEDDIILDAATLHIRIRPKRNRTIKSDQSVRDIPLVGLALESLKRAPGGFQAFRDNGDKLSQTLLRAMREHGLCPTPQHVIHSFRHSFEHRLLEADIDADLRRRLIGPKCLRAE